MLNWPRFFGPQCWLDCDRTSQWSTSKNVRIKLTRIHISHWMPQNSSGNRYFSTHLYCWWCSSKYLTILATELSQSCHKGRLWVLLLFNLIERISLSFSCCREKCMMVGKLILTQHLSTFHQVNSSCIFLLFSWVSSFCSFFSISRVVYFSQFSICSSVAHGWCI